jgi:hypothetical protein
MVVVLSYFGVEWEGSTSCSQNFLSATVLLVSNPNVLQQFLRHFSATKPYWPRSISWKSLCRRRCRHIYFRIANQSVNMERHLGFSSQDERKVIEFAPRGQQTEFSFARPRQKLPDVQTYSDNSKYLYPIILTTPDPINVSH